MMRGQEQEMPNAEGRVVARRVRMFLGKLMAPMRSLAEAMGSLTLLHIGESLASMGVLAGGMIQRADWT